MRKNNIITDKIKSIKIPQETQTRIIEKCHEEMEKKYMRKNTIINFKKPVMIALAIFVCLSVTCITTLATTGKLQGFFRDITNLTGAVTSTVYEQATDEIDIDILEVSDELLVEISMLTPEKAPYTYCETFGVNNYSITTSNGVFEIKNANTQPVEPIDNKAYIKIPINDIPTGEYNLIITELIGCSKADQPLPLKGYWECEFSK